MDSQTQHMLHLYMLNYIKKSGMRQTAEAFASETGISAADSGLVLAADLFPKWWAIFWDAYNSKIHAGFNVVEEIAESSAQAEARFQTQTQAVVQTQVQGESQDQAQVQALAEARFQAEIHAQSWALANNGMLGEPYADTLGHQYSGNNGNMLSEPVSSTWNGGQHGVLPGFMNDGFHPGWAFPSSNPRHNIIQVSRPSRRRGNRPERSDARYGA